MKIRSMFFFHYVMIHDSEDEDDDDNDDDEDDDGDDDDVRWWLNHEIEASVGTWYGREELSSSDLKGSPCKHESLVEICSQKISSGKRLENICISFAFPGRVIVPSTAQQRLPCPKKKINVYLQHHRKVAAMLSRITFR